jgi:hypothetical protein
MGAAHEGDGIVAPDEKDLERVAVAQQHDGGCGPNSRGRHSSVIRRGAFSAPVDREEIENP